MTDPAATETQDAKAARGMSVAELDEEISAARHARDVLGPHFGAALDGSRLQEILAGTLDNLSNYIGAMQIERDKRS